MFFLCAPRSACAIIPVELPLDQRMTFGARGLVLFMASYPLHKKWHVADFGKVGFAKRQRLLVEAERYGYVQYHSDRLANGRIDCYYTVHPVPVTERNRAFFCMDQCPPQKTNLKDKPCAYCGGVATTRDHIVPVSRGGSNIPTNVVPACLSCNSRKGNRTAEEAGMTLLMED